MKILLIFPGFILAIIIAVLYEIKLRKLFPILSNFSKIGKNKVHFYVARDKYSDCLWLYLSKPVRNADSWIPCVKGKTLYSEREFKNIGLNKEDFENLKWEDEPVEVFINIDD